MKLILAIVVVLVMVAVACYHFQYDPKPRSSKNGLQDLKALRVRHEVHSAFMAMIHDDGAGSWPPRATHDEFPPALRAYGEIYAAMAPLLPTANPSLDDECNRIRCQDFRSRMQALLREKVDMMATRSALETVESGNWDAFPRDAYNGFYSCIACLRHAYRYVQTLKTILWSIIQLTHYFCVQMGDKPSCKDHTRRKATSFPFGAGYAMVIYTAQIRHYISQREYYVQCRLQS
jgi:hypothetical protein